MGKYFGTDGFRGEANVTVTAEQAFALGRFFGWYLWEDKRRRGFPDARVRVVIGKDARRSGYMLEYALTAGLTASGADAYLLHVTTTPSVSYVTRSERFDLGVMISASHNPYTDNGIKLLSHTGEKLSEELLSLAEDYLDGTLVAFGEHWQTLPHATGARIGRTVDYIAGRNRYMGYLISLATRSFRGVRVGLDCANGSTWSLARGIYEALGATVYTIHAEPNGTNINEGAGSTHPEGLQKLVRERGLDIGFAFDGDGDRCIAVDENGEVVGGDQILYVAGRYLAGRGELPNRTVVATVMSNRGLVHSLEKEGIACALTPVGDKHVYAYMSKHGCALGGEASGHIIFGKHACTGDGLLTSLKLMEICLTEEKPLGLLTAGCKCYPQLLENVGCRAPARLACDAAVQEAVKRAEASLGGGRLLVRASGTEEVVRILAEGEDRESLARAVAEIRQVIIERETVCAEL